MDEPDLYHTDVGRNGQTLESHGSYGHSDRNGLADKWTCLNFVHPMKISAESVKNFAATTFACAFIYILHALLFVSLWVGNQDRVAASAVTITFIFLS